jgi:hypothetical protein
MATVNFLYRSTRNNANLVLRLLFTHDEKNFVIGANTKYQVSKEYWNDNHVINKKTKRITGTKDPEILNKRLDVNTELNKIENYVLNMFNSINPDEVNKEWLQNQIEYYYNPPKEEKNTPTNLINYIDFYIDYRKNEITKSTLKKIKVIKALLIRFEAFRKETIFINQINDEFKNEFVNYCKKELYAQNTIQRAFVFIKTFCKHAHFLGVETHHQLDGLRIERGKVEKIYLTFEDLEKIENIDKRRLNDNYDGAKDWLIISCYTAQRISDFMRFDKNMIRYEKNKKGVLKPFIEFTQVKTGKIMTVALHPKVMEIFNKRNGNFPKPISDPKYNLFIKQVCRLAKIDNIIKGSKLVNLKKKEKGLVKQYRKEVGMFKKWELVTSHIGRKSFCSNFYGTIPTSYLINVSGHSTETMFLNYIGKSNKDLAMEITNYF